MPKDMKMKKLNKLASNPEFSEIAKTKLELMESEGKILDSKILSYYDSEILKLVAKMEKNLDNGKTWLVGDRFIWVVGWLANSCGLARLVIVDLAWAD